MAGVDVNLKQGARLEKAEVTVAPLDDLDTQLMIQVRNGDDSAAANLIRRNFDRVARFLARFVRDSRSVEDLTQDVFTQVLGAAGRYEPRAKFSTWLYRIASNAALSHLQQAQSRRTSNADDRELNSLATEQDADPQAEASLDELRQRVAQALESLPANQRVALTLFQYEALSYEQVASAMNITVESVRCLIFRARTALREGLADLIDSR